MASVPFPRPPGISATRQPVLTANIAGIRLVLDGGEDLAEKVNPRLIACQLQEKREDQADQLELTLDNSDGRLAPLRKGVVLALALGWIQGSEVPLGLVDKGRFTVDELAKEGPPDTVTLRARSADLGGQYRQRRNKAHRDTTLGALITRIARAHGYRAAVHASLAGKPIAFAEQSAKSDMAFIRELGKRYDATATIKGRTLIFAPIAGGHTAAGTRLPLLTLTKRDGYQWRFSEAQREENDGAQAQYHDPGAARKRTAHAGGKNNPKRLKRTYASKPEAQAAADAQHSRQARASYSFEYTLALGDAAIEPERPVLLQGWDSQIDAIKWTVKEATHSFGGNDGLTTRLTLEGKD